MSLDAPLQLVKTPDLIARHRVIDHVIDRAPGKGKDAAKGVVDENVFEASGDVAAEMRNPNPERFHVGLLQKPSYRSRCGAVLKSAGRENLRQGIDIPKRSDILSHSNPIGLV
jgi:hypothetical protein